MGAAYINIQLSRQQKLPRERPLPHPPLLYNSITQDKEIPQFVQPISEKGGKRNYMLEKYFHFLRLTTHAFYHLSAPSTCSTEFQLQSIQCNSNLPWLCQIISFQEPSKDLSATQSSPGFYKHCALWAILDQQGKECRVFLTQRTESAQLICLQERSAWCLRLVASLGFRHKEEVVFSF